MTFTRSALYRFCIFFAVFDFLDIFSFIGFSDSALLLKYAYAAVVLSLILRYLLKFQTFDIGSAAPIIVLLLFIAFAIAFLGYYAAYGEKASFVSAFISPLVFSAAAVIPARRFVVDPEALCRSLLLLLTVGATCYAVEALFRASDLGRSIAFFTPEGSEHVKAVVCVLALAQSVLMRKKMLGIYLAGILVIAIVARPSSTFALATIVGVVLAILLAWRKAFAARLFAGSLLALAIIGPLALYFWFDDIAAAVTSLETYVKSDILGGTSNTPFRLAILRHAFARVGDWSFLFGGGFYGDINVNIADQFAYWRTVNEFGLVPVHSDFVILLMISGFVGYALFAIMLASVLRRRLAYAQAAARAAVSANYVMASIAAIALIMLTIYSSFNPYLLTYQHTHLLWVILLLSELVMRRRPSATTQPSSLPATGRMSPAPLPTNY